MGKTQSKRSVDITTEAKKSGEEEVTGKLEKIEDVDQKQVNGDATPQENNDAEKKDADESENDKDLTTEKSAEATPASGESGDQTNTTAITAESPKEDSAATKEETLNASEDISPLADESIKKSKKEKVKKKWSFRSISFGKKDKQKPAKTEETAEDVAVTNGEAEKLAADGVAEVSKEDEGAAGDAEAKPVETLENGEASVKELNGQKTPTEENGIAEVVANEITNTTTTETSSVTVPAASTETAIEKQTDNKAAISAEAVEVAATAAAVVSNGADAEKNGIESPVADVIKEVATDKAESEVSAAVVENNKTIPSVINDGEKPHQNGTNADADEPEAEAEQPKSQIEVKTNTDNTPAANLASSHFTSSDPIAQSNNSTNSDNLNEKAEEIVSAAISSDVACVAHAIDEVANPLNESRVSSQSDSQPPPLPISPPPSQVSVFAFNDDITATGEVPNVPVDTLLISPENDTAGEELPAEENEVALPTQANSDYTAAATEADNDAAVAIESQEIEKKDIAEINTEASIELNLVAAPIIGEVTATVAIDFSLQSVMSKNEEFIAAAAVIDEITEKAVEVIEQQQKKQQEEESQSVMQMEQGGGVEVEKVDVEVEETIDCTETETEKLVEETNKGTINEEAAESPLPPVAVAETPLAPIAAPDILTETEIRAELNIVQTQNQNEDCSSLIANEIEKLSLNVSDEALSQDIFSPTKEIANAKDLKETAAAEITTQDLPVTCE